MGRTKLARLPAPCCELGDAIRANAVHAELVQGFPLVGIVRGPGDDSRVDGMGAHDQLFIDERHLLPEILRPSGEERSHRIDVARNFEHTCSNGWKNPLHSFDNAMVESVHSATGGGLPYAPHDQRLDVGGLDFYVNPGLITDSIENGLKRGNLNAVRQRETTQIPGGEIGYSRSRLSPRVDDWIVVHDDDAVARGVHVQLDRVRSELDRAEKRGYRVLRERLMSPAVGDLFGRTAAARGGQEFLRVVFFVER